MGGECCDGVVTCHVLGGISIWGGVGGYVGGVLMGVYVVSHLLATWALVAAKPWQNSLK